MQVEWWFWIVGGIVLMLAELGVGSLFIIWFGMGALLVGALSWLVPALSLTAQLALWTGSSVALTVGWFRVFKPGSERARIGQAGGEALGETGLLVDAIAPMGRGRVRFQRPVIGAEEWVCLADEAIPAGERVKVVAVEGSFLKVSRA